MKMDTPTIIILTILNVLTMLMILLHTRLTRKTYPGFNVWLAGTALWSVGAILNFVLRDIVSPFWAIVVGNGLMQAVPVLYLEGLNRFYSIPGRWWRTPLNLALLAVSLIPFYYFSIISESISARSVTSSLASSILYSRIAIEPLLAPPARCHSMQWLLSVCLLPLIILHLLRVPFYLAHPELHTFAELIAKDKLMLMLMLMGSFITIVLNYSYLSLTSGRLEEELRTSEERMAEAYAAERESREMQDRFLDMISHEYRTPVAIIQANLDILDLKSAGLDVAMSPELTKMHRAVIRLVDIFEAAKRRGNLDLRTLKPVFETVAAEPYLREVLEVAVDLWSERFTLIIPPDVTRCIRVDRQMFQTALLNLLDNAVKYSPPDSTITMTVKHGAEFLRISVANNTRAELPEEMTNLLNKYQRGGNSAGTSGTGVGLYLVCRIIEQHGGGIQLDAVDKNSMLVSMNMPYDDTVEAHHAT